MLDKIGIPGLSPAAAPPAAYHFMVSFLGVGGLPIAPNPLDIRFQRVSGMEVSVPSQNMGQNGNESIRLPQWPQYSDLTLERGYVMGSPLRLELILSLEDLQFQQKDVLVMLLNESGIPIATWMFFGAYPVRWQVSDLDASQSSFLIETLVLSYKRLQVLSL
jgi:phage tail-like protein